MCKYCEPNFDGYGEYMDSTDVDFGYLGKGELYAYISDDIDHDECNLLMSVLYLPNDDCIVTKSEINYCPMCGRKLSKED